MPIRNEAELFRVASRAGELLQEIQDFSGRDRIALARVRFPRGYILTAETYRRQLAFVRDAHTRANLSYALMTLDVLSWLALRTDIYGTALEMVIKEAICLVGSICECLTVRRGIQGLGRNHCSFTDRTARLVELGIINDATKTDLDWVWEMRGREHLMDMDHAEFNHYVRGDYNRALRAYGELRDGLAARYEW